MQDKMGKDNIDYSTLPHFVNKRGQKLFCKYWNQEQTKPRAVVFICHGLGEHCLWYDDIASPLIKQGFYVFAHDHVGHGQSEGDRVHIKAFTNYTDDVIEHVSIIKEQYPDIPYFIIGHSMGGTITTRLLLDHPKVFDGAVLLAPALAPNPETATMCTVTLAKVVGYVMPQCPVAHVESKHLCRIEAIRKKYDEDPLVWHGGVKAWWVVCLLNTLHEFQTRFSEVDQPFFILIGDQDKLVEMSGCQMMYDKASSKDKKLKIFEGGYHQLHNEPDGMAEETIKDMSDWISTRVDAFKKL